jgi:hypothetical protein
MVAIGGAPSVGGPGASAENVADDPQRIAPAFGKSIHRLLRPVRIGCTLVVQRWTGAAISPPGNSRSSFPKRFARAFDHFANRSGDPARVLGAPFLGQTMLPISDISHGPDQYARSHRP